MNSKQVIKQALDTFGYMLQFRRAYSSLEFAALIKEHAANAQALALANELASCPWYVIKGRSQATVFLSK